MRFVLLSKNSTPVSWMDSGGNRYGGDPAVAAIVAADVGPQAVPLEDGYAGAFVIAFGRDAVTARTRAQGDALTIGIDDAATIALS